MKLKTALTAAALLAPAPLAWGQDPDRLNCLDRGASGLFREGTADPINECYLRQGERSRGDDADVLIVRGSTPAAPADTVVCPSQHGFAPAGVCHVYRNHRNVPSQAAALFLHDQRYYDMGLGQFTEMADIGACVDGQLCRQTVRVSDTPAPRTTPRCIRRGWELMALNGGPQRWWRFVDRAATEATGQVVGEGGCVAERGPLFQPAADPPPEDPPEPPPPEECRYGDWRPAPPRGRTITFAASQPSSEHIRLDQSRTRRQGPSSCDDRRRTVWLDPITRPTVTASISPGAVDIGTAAVLTWSSTGATQCDRGAGGPSGSQNVGPWNLHGQRQESVRCQGAGGWGTATASVTVNGCSVTEWSPQLDPLPPRGTRYQQTRIGGNCAIERRDGPTVPPPPCFLTERRLVATAWGWTQGIAPLFDQNPGSYPAGALVRLGDSCTEGDNGVAQTGGTYVSTFCIATDFGYVDVEVECPTN